MTKNDFAKTAVLTILEELDYDIFKQFDDPEMSEDPEHTKSKLKKMIGLLVFMLEGAEYISFDEEPVIIFNKPVYFAPYGWYVNLINNMTMFLHNNGEICFGAIGKNINDYSGYYETEELAFAAIEQYNKSNA